MVESLNKEVDVAIKVNSFLNPMSPKPGVLAVGDVGIEYRASNGVGFIQVPWENVTLVKADVYLKGKYIRGFDIITTENQELSFVTSNAMEALKAMRKHLAKEQMVQSPSNFKRLFKRKK